MKSREIGLQFSVCALVLFTHLSAAQEFDERSVLAEVEKYYSEYVSVFSNRQVERIADEYYIAPAYLRSGDETHFFETRSEIVEYFNTYFANLSDASYARSESMDTNICILSSTTATLSTGFRRFGNDGSIILESAATYFLIKLNGQWRISSGSTHDIEDIIECGE